MIRARRCLDMYLLRKYAIPRMAKCRSPHLVQILLILHRFRAGERSPCWQDYRWWWWWSPPRAKIITRLLSPAAAAAGGGAIGGAVGGGAVATEPCAAGNYSKYKQIQQIQINTAKNRRKKNISSRALCCWKPTSIGIFILRDCKQTLIKSHTFRMVFNIDYIEIM